jgi:hypothetical protein
MAWKQQNSGGIRNHHALIRNACYPLNKLTLGSRTNALCGTVAPHTTGSNLDEVEARTGMAIDAVTTNKQIVVHTICRPSILACRQRRSLLP